MSEYADIKIKELSLFTFRNTYNKKIVSLFFTNDDLKITNGVKYNNQDEDEEPHIEYKCETTVLKAKQRLEALGYTLKRFEEKFNHNKTNIINYDEFSNRLRINYDDEENEINRRIEKNITYKKWANSLKKYISYELRKGNIYEYNHEKSPIPKSDADKIIYYSYISDEYDKYYGLLTNKIEVEYIIRQILEFCKDNDKIIFDFSTLFYWDNISKEQMNFSNELEKNIVLVEGTSDKDIIEFALKNIYPHLFDLFYFMDFEYASSKKRDGGSSYVIKNIETFMCSKINKKFIALLDNDAEGSLAKEAMINEIKNIPDNIKILTYPDLEYAKKYPTVAINGKIVKDNINGKACSIELYLPDSMLKNGIDFFPIEWESRKVRKIDDKDIYRYQGVISGKNEIKKNFNNYKNMVINNKKKFNKKEWEKAKLLLDHFIFN